MSLASSSQLARACAFSWTCSFSIATAACVFGPVRALAVEAAVSSRERISINADWRFTKGDPAGTSVSLSYDIRPPAAERAGEHPGPGAVATQRAPTNGLAASQPEGIKPWILPTGNEFIKDGSHRFSRPRGNPGGGVAYVQAGFDDSSWRRVNLPHDWAIEGPFSRAGGGGMGRLPTAGVGWYRKKLSLPAADAGKCLFLDVDGAMSYSTVWLNGQLAGGWPYGYSSWRVDLTPYVEPGKENELVIRLDNPPSSSRWYPGAGLYRNVWLVKTAMVHVGHWGTWLTTPEVSPSAATIKLKVAVDNNSKQGASATVATRIFSLNADGHRTGAAVASIGPTGLQIAPSGSVETEGTGTIVHPKLWGPPPRQQPNRYVAVTTVVQGSRVVDAYETPFGIRTINFESNAGCSINGELVPLNGVCDHHDLGALGAAVNYRALQRQLEMLSEMGGNAIRTSHNPPAPELLELTDKMGMLVMDETFDCWQRAKTPNDYHLLFDEWHEQDLRAHVRRDRNCPSVILWSIGNEVGEQFRGAAGAVLAKQLGEIVHEEDLTRPITTAMNWSQATNPFTASVEIIGLNYQGAGIRGAPGQYPVFHEKFPDKPLIGSETASALSSRGEYLFPVATGYGAAVGANAGEERARHQVSAYELYAAAFGASADKVFASQKEHPYVAGEFVWTGWDYLGEPTPFDSSRSSYSGIIDLAGFKKDRFYLYQAHWRPEFPMAHILPHWTWPERRGQVTPVHVFTSGDEGELFLNGKSLGRKRKGPKEYRLRWDDVVYEPGTLKVVTWKNGRRWASEVMKTAGDPAQLKLHPDHNRIQADGRDLSFITVTVKDKDGRMAPRADNRIRFEIDGPGEIVGTDNGDPTSFESFQSPERKAFNGLCLVIVRGKSRQPGTIKLSAKADGLNLGMASIQSIIRVP
jgi:beta-galactosidase